MEKEILKLLPQKAFKLISIKETFRIGASVTKSFFDKKSYDDNFLSRSECWKFDDIKLVKEFSFSDKPLLTKDNGEKILKIYFSQFFEKNLAIHIDLRRNHFSSNGDFFWIPSKTHHNFTHGFIEGVRLLYVGFYFEDSKKFEDGLIKLGMIKESMGEDQKNDIKELFLKHFGEGKNGEVKFKLEKLQKSFDEIFSYFIKEDIPLNPEFAVLGVYLVTLYLTLQDIPYALNVNAVFNEVFIKGQH